MIANLHKWLTIASLVVGGLSGLLTTLQSSGIFAASPPHWMAVAGTVLGVAGLIVAKALELFSSQVQVAQVTALAAKQPAAAQAALTKKS